MSQKLQNTRVKLLVLILRSCGCGESYDRVLDFEVKGSVGRRFLKEGYQGIGERSEMVWRLPELFVIVEKALLEC